MKRFKKFLKFFVGLFGPIYLVIDKYGFSEYLKKNYSESQADIVWWITLSLILLATYLNFRISIQNPEKKYDAALRSKQAYLKVHFQKHIDELYAVGFIVRFNVMKEKQLLGYKSVYPLEKGKKLENFIKNIRPRIYKDIGTYPDGYTIPKNFLLGVDQGTNALSTEENEVTIFGLNFRTDENICSKLKIDSKQYKYVKKSSLLVSVPIIGKDSSSGSQGFVGVLTMESPILSEEHAKELSEKNRGLELYKIDKEYDLSQENKQDMETYKELRNLVSSTMIKLEESYRLLNF